MCARQGGNITKLAGALAITALLAGCVAPSNHESRGVKLSDAMQASANADTRDLGGRSSNEPSSDSHEAVRGSTTTHEPRAIDTLPEDDDWKLPMDVRYERPFSGDLLALTHFTITPVSSSSDDEPHYLGLFIGGATVEARSGSLTDQGAENLWMLEIGISYRRYLNSSKTALSPYIGGNIFYECLFWDYRHPIISDGESFRWDSLSGIGGSLVFGISTHRHSRVSFFAEAGVGSVGFFEKTTFGFKNDVVGSYAFFSLKAGLTLRF